MIYEFAVAMKDMVTPGAKSAKGGIEQLTSALTQAKNIGAEAISGLTSGLGAVARGDFPSVFRSIGSGVGDMLNTVNLAVPGLGSLLSGLSGVVFGIGGALLDLAQKGMGMVLTFSEAKEKTIALYDALADGQATGKAVAGMIGELARATHKTGGDFKPFAKELMAMGHRTLPDLRQELLAVASAQALMGDEAGAAYMNMAKKIEIAVESGGKLKMSSKSLGRDLTAMGLSLGDVADGMKMTGAELAKALKAGTLEADKFGEVIRRTVTEKGKGALDRFGHSLEGIGNDFSRFWKKAFADADPSPFLNTLREMVAGLGGGKDATKSLTGALNAFFKFAAKAVPWVVFGIWDLVDSVLEVAVAFKTGGSTGNQALDMIVANLKMVGFWISQIVDGLKTMGDLMGGLKDVGKTGVLGPVGLILGGDDDVKLGDAVTKAMQAAQQAANAANAQAPAVGKGFTDGVAQGLKSGEGPVAEATKELGKKMVSTLKNELQVKSPSRVMMGVGLQTARGFALGVQQGAPLAASMASSMGRATASASFVAPTFPSPGTAPGSDRSGGARGPITVHVHVHIDGSQSAKEIAEQITEEAMATVFEKLAATQGL